MLRVQPGRLALVVFAAMGLAAAAWLWQAVPSAEWLRETSNLAYCDGGACSRYRSPRGFELEYGWLAGRIAVGGLPTELSSGRFV